MEDTYEFLNGSKTLNMFSLDKFSVKRYFMDQRPKKILLWTEGIQKSFHR